jgi:DNA-binding MarR family transcriptional regulator
MVKKTTHKSTRYLSEHARLVVNLTLQLEKYSQVKESFFSRKFKLTPVEFKLMRILKKDGVKSTKNLAELMKLSPGRITHLLNSLDTKQFITRYIDTNDRRSIRVKITDHAHIYLDKVIKEYYAFHDEITGFLPTENRQEILNDLKIFLNAMNEWAESYNL